MKAMLFAAGLGTRLKPLTDTMPKAMVPIAGKPLLEHVILKLKASGFDEIIVNVHHFADQIIDFLKEKNNFGIHIEISDEREMLLETGGGIKKAASFFNDNKPFLVHNVDILSDIDLNALYNAHIEKNAFASLLVSKRITSRYLLFDGEDKLQGWINEKTGETKSPLINFNPLHYDKYAFAGIHVISPEVFNYMNNWEGKFSIIDFYLSIADKVKIQGYSPNELNMIDVGKLDSLNEAELFLANH
jgi:NDP-sugar pyrophosphorylase family protein